jgi:hypothetical protein
MEKWLFRFILFVSILVSGSLYPIVFGGVLPTILILVTFFVLFVLKFNYTNNVLKVFGLNLFLIVSVLLIHFFLNGANNHENDFFKFIFRLITALSVLLAYSLFKREVLKDFIWVMNILLVHSVFNFLFGFILPGNLEVVKAEQINCLTFKYIFFYFSESSSSGYSFLRNQGIFWEPGVLSVFLNILLFVYLFVRPNITRGLVVFATIFTTFSTTGLVLSFLLFIVKYNKNIRKSFAALFIGLSAIGVLLPLVIENVNDKVSGKGEASFYWRSYDLLISFQIVSENPIKGIGFGGEVYKKVQEQNKMFMQSDILEGRGNTNSMVYIFIAFGIPLAIYILYLLYNQTIFPYKNKYLFFIVSTICLSTEPLITSVFFLIIVFSHLFSTPKKELI